MTPYLNHLIETVQIRGHNICFYAELTKIIPNYHQILLLALVSRHQGGAIALPVHLYIGAKNTLNDPAHIASLPDFIPNLIITLLNILVITIVLIYLKIKKSEWLNCLSIVIFFYMILTPPHMPVCPAVFLLPFSHGSKCVTWE